MYKIVIIEDNKIFAEALKDYIEIILEYNVIKIFDSGKDFLNQNFKINEIDLLLVDIHLPDVNGYEIAKQYNYHDWRTPMIAITFNKDILNLKSLIPFGFRGAIHKSNIYLNLEIAIKKVMNGKLYFPDIKL